MTAMISSLGVLGVFLLMVPESACIPIPSELTLLFSGFAVSQHWLSLPLAVLAATAGNLIGSLIAYALGASHLLDGIPGVGPLAARSEQMLDRYGTRAVFFARLLPLARTFVSLPAGARRVPLLPFVTLTTVGCAIWAALFILVGLLSGTAWQAVNSWFGKALLITLAIVVGHALIRHQRGHAMEADRVRRRRR